MPVRTAGALATATHPVARTRQPQTPPNLSRAIQGSLFQDKPASKVIPFEAYAPPPLVTAPAPPRPRHRNEDHKPVSRRSHGVPEAQGNLDLLPSQPAAPRTLSTTVDALIYCDAPVATSLHRTLAAVLDWSMVLIAFGLFLLIFHALGGKSVLNQTNAMMFGAMLPLCGFTYGLVWAIAGSETAGMRWMRLRLTTFDGFRPDPRQRLLRFLGSCLAVSSVLGLLWSLADEESLGWQDHISHTFPTPCVLDHQVFRRA